MDDYNLSTITESKNEWCARLVNILTPCIIEGIKSVFDEGYKMCSENNEEEKYLMTFQNLLNNIPKWSSEIVSVEKDRIEASSHCNYLEDLLTCVHITQLKALTSSRAGIKQKKVDIDIPSLYTFIHKTYINVARKVYVNVYLFEKDIMPLQIQKNNRELETIIKECILNTIRENIPIENILKTYLDETLESDVEVVETREVVADDELIQKQNKIAKEKELETVKQLVKDKIEKEQKESLNHAIKRANKEMNTSGGPPSDLPPTELNKIETHELPVAVIKPINTELETEIDLDMADLIEPHDDRLNLDSTQTTDVQLNIESLNSDPDKLEFDNLDFNSGDINDLEIMELK
tara:strand:- start:4178 stop:5227 length:1050 start_codon:yes stop_codon:yes gene_type:complete